MEKASSPVPDSLTPTATRIEGLCAGYQLARDFGTAQQAKSILNAIVSGVAFQLQTQIRPESAMYLPDPPRALGAVRRSLISYEIRIDYVQHAMSATLGLHRILGHSQ